MVSRAVTPTHIFCHPERRAPSGRGVAGPAFDFSAACSTRENHFGALERHGPVGSALELRMLEPRRGATEVSPGRKPWVGLWLNPEPASAGDTLKLALG